MPQSFTEQAQGHTEILRQHLWCENTEYDGYQHPLCVLARDLTLCLLCETLR